MLQITSPDALNRDTDSNTRARKVSALKVRLRLFRPRRCRCNRVPSSSLRSSQPNSELPWLLLKCHSTLQLGQGEAHIYLHLDISAKIAEHRR